MRIQPQAYGSRFQRALTSPSAAAITAAVLAVLVASAPAQRQFDELRKRGLPGDNDPTQAVAFGDVDGDGDLDMVCGNDTQNRLYLNNGDGTFTDVTATRMPVDVDATRAVAFGDVDGDGDLDLVCGNYGTLYGQQNRLYLNNGSGTFTDATATRMPVDNQQTSAVVLGDVDGDGDLDLVFANTFVRIGNAQNRLYLNNGAGTFTDATTTRMPVDYGLTRAVAFGDVDGDGDLDLVCGNASLIGGQQNRLYLNNGAGTFTDATAARLPVDLDHTHAVTLGDVDLDGDLDLVCGNYYGQNRLYLNNGNGTFTDATAARMPVDNDFTRAIVLGDVDGDGDLDLVCGNSDFRSGQQNRLYLNNRGGTFTDATATRMPIDNDFTVALALGDVDRDGDLDLVFGNSGWPNDKLNRLYLNNGSGNFTDATAARLPVDDDDTRAVALGDVDGDGDLDIVCGNSSRYINYGGQNLLYLNNGNGTFTDATTARMPVDGDDTRAVAFGDVDRDGDLDIVCVNHGPTGQQNRLYVNNGSGTFTDRTAARMPVDGDTTLAVALGDVDGDGDLDLICGNSGQNRLYLNNGGGTFTDATTARMPVDSDSTLAVALVDVDGDGDLDLVCGNYGQNRLYLNNGTGTFTDVTALRMPVDNDITSAVALGDVDGDGDLDLVCGNSFARFRSPQTRLYLNDGSGTFADVTAARLPVDTDSTAAVVVGDIDGDGDLDLVCGKGHYNGGVQNRLYLNNGNGVFTDATAVRMPIVDDVTTAVAIGDVDGDGDLDMICGNGAHLGPGPQAGPRNRLYLNLLRQLDVPFVPGIGKPYTLEAYARYGPPSAVDVAVPFLSAASVSVPWAPFGTLRLDPAQLVALPAIAIPRPAGVGAVSFTIPNVRAFAGITLYSQAMLLSQPFPALLTNGTADVILR